MHGFYVPTDLKKEKDIGQESRWEEIVVTTQET